MQKNEYMFLYNIAQDHLLHGRHSELEVLMNNVLAQFPDDPEALYVMGSLAANSDIKSTAIELLQASIKIKPMAESYYNLGVLFKSIGRFDQAADNFNHAFKLRPNSTEALENMALSLERLGRYQEALDYLHKALLTTKNKSNTLNMIGNILLRCGNFNRAIDYYYQGLDLDKTDTSLLNNLALALKFTRRIDEAIEISRQLVQLDPENPGFHYNYGTALLTRGDFKEGLREYYWRWKTDALSSAFRRFSQPRWIGEDIAGKKLLVHGEQGFGDTLQFCRYASMAAARGIRVIIDTPRPLARLLRSLKGVDSVISTGDPLPDFDYHCSMIDLMACFSTDVRTIPSETPYLFADDADLDQWEKRLPRVLNIRKVGLAWKGNPRPKAFEANAVDRRRSLPIELMSPLMKIPDIQFYSLQKDNISPVSPIIDIMSECDDFASTAAMIMQLDLVISVDTSIVHLAGALGKPVWLMDRFDACWRWLINREDSPWYPTLRIFRQNTPGDWDDVISRVCKHLTCF